MNTRTRPPSHRLAALIALPLVAFAGGCGVGADREPLSGPAATVTPAGDSVPDTTDPLPVLEVTSGTATASAPSTGADSGTPSAAVAVGNAGATSDLDQVDADLAELDTQLSEADRDLATPEGDF